MAPHWKVGCILIFTLDPESREMEISVQLDGGKVCMSLDDVKKQAQIALTKGQTCVVYNVKKIPKSTIGDLTLSRKTKKAASSLAPSLTPTGSGYGLGKRTPAPGTPPHEGAQPKCVTVDGILLQTMPPAQLQLCAIAQRHPSEVVGLASASENHNPIVQSDTDTSTAPTAPVRPPALTAFEIPPRWGIEAATAAQHTLEPSHDGTGADESSLYSLRSRSDTTGGCNPRVARPTAWSGGLLHQCSGTRGEGEAAPATSEMLTSTARRTEPTPAGTHAVPDAQRAATANWMDTAAIGMKLREGSACCGANVLRESNDSIPAGVGQRTYLQMWAISPNPFYPRGGGMVPWLSFPIVLRRENAQGHFPNILVPERLFETIKLPLPTGEMMASGFTCCKNEATGTCMLGLVKARSNVTVKFPNFTQSGQPLTFKFEGQQLREVYAYVANAACKKVIRQLATEGLFSGGGPAAHGPAQRDPSAPTSSAKEMIPAMAVSYFTWTESDSPSVFTMKIKITQVKGCSRESWKKQFQPVQGEVVCDVPQRF